MWSSPAFTIDVLTSWPSPVRSRSNSAAVMAMADSRALPVSPMFERLHSGGLPASQRAVLPFGARQGGGRLVGAGQRGPRPLLVAPRVAVHEPGEAGRQRLVVEAQPCGGARPPVGGDDVGAVEEPVEDRAALGVLEVQGDAALAPVGAEAHVGAGPVRVVQRVDLDDVGAQVGEDPPGEGAGDAEAEVDHADAGQRVRQRRLPARRAATRPARPRPPRGSPPSAVRGGEPGRSRRSASRENSSSGPQ